MGGAPLGEGVKPRLGERGGGVRILMVGGQAEVVGEPARVTLRGGCPDDFRDGGGEQDEE